MNATTPIAVAIHNKNGKGLLQEVIITGLVLDTPSQSTIKMEKGYYSKKRYSCGYIALTSQSTIKMEKGYYANNDCQPPVR